MPKIRGLQGPARIRPPSAGWRLTKWFERGCGSGFGRPRQGPRPWDGQLSCDLLEHEHASVLLINRCPKYKAGSPAFATGGRESIIGVTFRPMAGCPTPSQPRDLLIRALFSLKAPRHVMLRSQRIRVEAPMIRPEDVRVALGGGWRLPGCVCRAKAQTPPPSYGPPIGIENARQGDERRRGARRPRTNWAVGDRHPSDSGGHIS